MATLYWHDYETWGADPTIDRPCQFAGVRTDENLNIVGDPLVLYCQPPPDILPHPQACLVTGIAPQKAEAEGVPENRFIAAIHDELAQPGTCGVGYNSLRFDDEITRHTLYRNFYDPYEREWRNGNSRWDIIDMVRLAYALRPEGIEWPVIDGRPSFKLENLTAANGIGHAAAHDAYADVEATIQLAKLVREKQPQLYDYVFTHRAKKKTAALVDVANRKPLLHISSMFPAQNGCAALVVPLAMHPVNRNAVVVYDLSQAPQALLDADDDALERLVFTREDDLEAGETRIPLKLIHLNKCPVLTTPKLLTDAAAQRLNIDKTACEANWHALRHADLAPKLERFYRAREFLPRKDPERQLYDGFIPDRDKPVMAQVRTADANTLADHSFVFDDKRLPELLFRYKARNFPQSLTTREMDHWREFCRLRLEKGDEGCLSLNELRETVDALLASGDLDKNKRQLLGQVVRYGEALLERTEGRPHSCRR